MYTISSAPLNLLSLMSTPTISVAPAFLAAWITDRPSAPRPKTATDFWGSIFVVLKTAPHPVETPQPFFYGNGKYWIKFSINWIINLNHFYLRDTSCSNQLQDGFWQQIFQQWLHIQRMLNIPKTQELKWFKSRALSEIRYHEMEDLPSILGKTGSSVRHKALSLSCSNLRAKVGLVTLAKNAFLLTAFRSCANNNWSRKWVHI